MKTVHVVNNIQYWGTVSHHQLQVPDTSTAKEIWLRINPEAEEAPNTEASDNYLEDWTAYGSHHKGVITQAWWGEGAEEKANQRYAELLTAGAKPE